MSITWQDWAPPLNPPTDGGLDAGAAAEIAAAVWAADPHLCAALQWEAYAATLPPGPSVSNMSTGGQSVTFSPAAPTGDYGAAMNRAAWHRSFVSGLGSVPLRVPHAAAPPPLAWRPVYPMPAAARPA
jgi:hypothetical protein